LSIDFFDNQRFVRPIFFAAFRTVFRTALRTTLRTTLRVANFAAFEGGALFA